VNTGEVVVRTIETGGHTEYTPVGHVTVFRAILREAQKLMDCMVDGSV
jgi:hypothetical protein